MKKTNGATERVERHIIKEKEMEMRFKVNSKEEMGVENEKLRVRPADIAVWEAYIRDGYCNAENELAKKSEKISSANDRQIGGSHYKDKPIQPWDVIDNLPHAQAIGFYKGNAIKYLMRAGDKGPAREDYEKAVHYLEKLLEIL
jgi:hypothetical protein